MHKRSVVVVGGGTGTHTVLRGLKHYQDHINITAVVSMADSGGSTGRLRDEFGQLPVGDVRMALSALAEDQNSNDLLLRELFLYRFNNGNGLKGHNLGNLLLTALSDMLGGEAAAIAAASKILRVAGQVLPVTTDNVHLTATYDDGVMAEGEHLIDEPAPDRGGRRISKLGLKPRAVINPQVATAILEADMVVVGPGDLYSSLLANFVVDGVGEAIKNSKAKLVYIANLMERFGQTEGMGVTDCVSEINRYVGKWPDIVLINNKELSAEALAWYHTKDGMKPVRDDLYNYEGLVERHDLLSTEMLKQDEADQVNRSLIRHDSSKLARAVMDILKTLST